MERKRRNELIIIIFLSVLIVVAAYIETRLPQVSSNIPIGRNIIIFSLININIILLLLLIFLVIRNIVKLIFERKRKILGAKLRTKLVIAFVSLSLLPTMILFFVSMGFISHSFENWFNLQIEKSLQESLDVAKTYYKTRASSALHYAEVIKSFFIEKKLSKKEIKSLVERKRDEYNLSMVELYLNNDKERFVAVNPKSPLLSDVKADEELLKKGFQGEKYTKIYPLFSGEMVSAVVPILDKKSKKRLGVVVTHYFIPLSLVKKMGEISQTVSEYRQLKILKKPIKTTYFITLLLVTLLIIFSATWFGMFLAKEITVPIKELAEASHKVAMGELDVKLDLSSKDEIGSLVTAFNKMTEDLREQREKIRATTENLKATNIELEQRRRYMEIVLKSVAAGVISVDNEGIITTINSSAEKILEIEAKRYIGKKYKDIFDKEYHEIIKDLENEMEKSNSDTVEKQINLKVKEKVFTLFVHLTRLRDDKNLPMGIVAVFDDITHILKAQRIEAWREVARRIAHEIKNPLTPIQLSAQRLKKRYLDKIGDDKEIFEDCTKTITHQVEELKNLVNEFARFARMPHSLPIPDDLNDTIREAIILFKESHRKIKFIFKQDKTLPLIDIDREQIKRVMINLIKNSISALNGKGRIEVETMFAKEKELVYIEVRDNGKGIDPEAKHRLLEPYFSTRQKGTGLGLAIVNTIISDHNGRIRFEDNKPKGTKVIIELPIKQEQKNDQ